jgi:chromosome segregation ATPase
VRVDGHGEASVLDVVCQNKTVKSDDKVSNEKINQLKAEIKELEVQRAKISAKLDRTNRQTQILNEFATNLAKPTVGPNKENPSLNASSQENVNNFLNFMDTYLTKSESLDSNKYSIEKELESVNEKLNVANDNLNRLNYNSYNQQM